MAPNQARLMIKMLGRLEDHVASQKDATSDRRGDAKHGQSCQMTVFGVTQVYTKGQSNLLVRIRIRAHIRRYASEEVLRWYLRRDVQDFFLASDRLVFHGC